jgi:hypothetical protein
MITLNAIEQRLRQFAENHFFIHSYGFGSPDEVDLDKYTAFPLLYVVYTGATYDEGSKAYTFEVYVMDRPTEQEAKSENRREVVSDSEQCLEDLVADITTGFNVFQWDEAYNVEAASVSPIVDARTNVLSGALLDLTISVPYQYESCNLPLDGVQPEGGEISYARRGLLRILTQDGTVDVPSVNTIRVTNGTLTDEGGGVVSLSITGGGGGGAVDSVNGQTGVVVLYTDDIDEGTTNVYYTDARVQAHLESGDVDQINLTDNAVFTWNETDGAVDIAYTNGVTLQVGQEEHFYAKATEAIANGELVMFAGAQGSHLLIRKADPTVTGFVPDWIVGVATQSFAANEFGYVTSFGKVRGLNTDGFLEGALLWMDPNNPGQLTATQPAPPAHIILVAANVYKHATQGTLFVRLSHTQDTDETPEGSTNLYYTADRVDARISAAGLATVAYVDAEVGAEESARITADSGLQSQITTNAGNIATNADDITALDGRMTTAEADIAALEAITHVNSLNGLTGAVTLSAGTGINLSTVGNNVEIIATGGTAGTVSSVNSVLPDGSGNVALDTDDVPEGSTKLYYTDARADGRIAAASVTDLSDVTSAGSGAIITTAERSKLAGIEAGAEVNPTAAEIKTAYESNANTNAYTDAEKSKLAGIAAGAEVNVNADWNATSGDAQIQNKPTLAAVATSGAYGDLSGTPTIPPQFFYVTISAATSINLNTGDEGKYIRTTASSAVTVTVPSGKFQPDDEILFEQAGTGQITVVADTGVTLNNSASNTARSAERFAVLGLKCVATDEFTLTGERELV